MTSDPPPRSGLVSSGLSSLALVALAAEAALCFSWHHTDAGVIKSFVAEGLALFGAAILALRIGWSGDPAARAGLRRAVLAVGPLLAAGAVSAALAAWHPLARARLEDVATGCVIAALAACAPFGTRDARWTALALALGGAIASIYGAFQIAGIDFIRWSGSTERQYLFRSTFGHHSFAAAFLVAAIPPAAGIALSRSLALRARALSAAAAIVMTVGLFLSQGRGAWIGFFVAMVVLGLLVLTRVAPPGVSRRRALLFVAAPIVVLGALSFLVESGAERWASFLDPESSSIRSRKLIYDDTIRMVEAKPILGHGIGLYAVAYPRFRSEASLRNLPAGQRVVDHAHDEVLEVAAEQGLAGLLALAFFLVVVVRAAFRRRGFTGLDAGYLASIAGLLVHNLFDVNFRVASTAVPFFLAAGFLLRPDEDALAPGGPRREPSVLARFASVVAALALLVAIARPYARDRFDAALHFARYGPQTASRAEALQRCVGQAPDWPEALFSAGCALAQEGRARGPERGAPMLSLAIADLEKLRSLAPYYANMPLPLAETYALTGREDEALETARDFARVFPTDGTGHLLVSKLLGKKGNLGEAENAAARAVADDPFNLDAQITLGSLREKLGMQVEASYAFADAVALAPRRPDLRASLAQCAVGETQLDVRIESLFIALELARGKARDLNAISPFVLMFHSHLLDDRRGDYVAAILARYRGERAEALSRYRDFADWAKEKGDPRIRSAVDLADSGEWDEADRLFDEAEEEVWARIDPWRRTELATRANATAADFGAILEPETRWRLGLSLARNGNPKAALDVMLAPAAEAAGRPLRSLAIGDLALALGRPEVAAAAFRAALDAPVDAPVGALDDPLHEAIALDEAVAGARLSVATRTREDMDRRVAAKEPEPWDLYLHASYLEAIGEKEAAIAGYRDLLARVPAHWIALDRLRALGDPAAAETAAARETLRSRALLGLARAERKPPGANLGSRGDGFIAAATSSLDAALGWPGRLVVGSPGASAHLGAGFAQAERLGEETWIRWALGPRCEVFGRLGSPAREVEVEARAPEGLAGRMTVIWRGGKIGETALAGTFQVFRFAVKPDAPEGPFTLELLFDRFASPRERTASRDFDGRPLAAAVKCVSVR